MIKACEHCKKEFSAYREKMKTCSRACAVQVRTGPLKANKIDIKCASCAAIFKLTPYKAATRGDNATCSSNCRGELISKAGLYDGRSNPNFRLTSIKTCLACKKEYHSFTKGRKYCSAKCSHIDSAPMALRNLRLGNVAENMCAQWWSDRGAFVWLAKNSRGPFDVMVIDPAEGPVFIQVKASNHNYALQRAKGIKEIKRLGDVKGKKQVWCLKANTEWEITDVMADGTEGRRQLAAFVLS